MHFDRGELEEQLIKDYVKEQQSESEPPRWFLQPKMLTPLIFLAFLIFLGYAWYTDKFTISQSDSSPPLIKASSNPVRIKPDDPGGIQFNNKDKVIYRAIMPGDKLPSVTRILSAPEKPLDREIIVADKTKEGDRLIKEMIIEELIDKEQERERVAENIITAIPKSMRKRALIKPIETIKYTHKIQLGAYRSDSDVETHWNMFRNKHKDVLDGLVMIKEKADLGQKGIFYRLQAGGFSSKNDARRVCQQLIDRKQGCFVVQ